VPQVLAFGPLQELGPRFQFRPEPWYSIILSDVSPSPHRPGRFSGKLQNGHTSISSGFILRSNSARKAGVNPLRVRAT
jgi:hypothetical protein